MPRIDLSDSLIHWTKGEDYQSAFDVLLAIIYENRLLAGCGDIKGQYYFVCFTETPKDVFHLVKGKYKPFGICIPKDHVYSLGGGNALAYDVMKDRPPNPLTHSLAQVR